MSDLNKNKVIFKSEQEIRDYNKYGRGFPFTV